MTAIAVLACAAATTAAPAQDYGGRIVRFGNTSAWSFDGRDDDRDFPTNGFFPGNFGADPPGAAIGAAGLFGSTPWHSALPYPSIGQGQDSVECVTLDQALRDVTPTILKFDIEGAELDALAGAREVIARSRPVLAVSCYHQQSHLWEIPLELARTCHDYQFFLRPHGVEGWDLLCYAVPQERLRRRN